jgi:hypothetical protein
VDKLVFLFLFCSLDEFFMRGLSPDERNLSTDDADYTEQNQKLETRNKKTRNCKPVLFRVIPFTSSD